VIVLDTHVWVWWADGGGRLPQSYQAYIQAHASGGLGVSAVSCWEVAKLVELGRLQLACAVEQWLVHALVSPVQLLPLSPEIAVVSTRLPGPFHRDPADQIIVATARVFGCPLVTMDAKIRGYAHVQLGP
jgi:PIN domain nuclease of toxin-antitoxin system